MSYALESEFRGLQPQLRESYRASLDLSVFG